MRLWKNILLDVVITTIVVTLVFFLGTSMGKFFGSGYEVVFYFVVGAVAFTSATMRYLDD